MSSMTVLQCLEQEVRTIEDRVREAGASTLAARHPVFTYGGHGRVSTVVWGTTCQGPE